MRHLKIIAKHLGYTIHKKNNRYFILGKKEQIVNQTDCLYGVARFLGNEIQKMSHM